MRRALHLHPDSVRVAATDVEVEVARPQPDRLILSYVVRGSLSDLLLPHVVASTRADELWQHTCFEAFVRTSANPGYYEFNFAPSTQWAIYHFDSYRSGMRIATEIGAPQIEVDSTVERYTLRAALEIGSLSSPFRLGLSAVLEETNGRRSYWALAHPPGKSDFHHSDCFALELA
jgi:hypothetical protein